MSLNNFVPVSPTKYKIVNLTWNWIGRVLRNEFVIEAHESLQRNLETVLYVYVFTVSVGSKNTQKICDGVLINWCYEFLVCPCGWCCCVSLSVQPGKDSIWLPVLVGLRLVFIPLFMLCNVQPRYYLPVLFAHDAWYIIFMIFFSFSNGYLASLCMCFGPK